MHKPDHVFVAITEEYRKLREIQTFLNRLVWSTELCYGYFLNTFENNTNLYEEEISKIFENLPIQAWFKNKNGTGKYDLTLKEHNDIVRANQVHVCRSAIILYNSYFDEYLKRRVKSKFHLFLNLTNKDFDNTNLDVDPKNIFKADCCRIIRNIIVHQPANRFLSIKEIRDEIKQKMSDKLNGSFLNKKYSNKIINEKLNGAINEVIDNAIIEVEGASQRGVILPYEYFFMLYTFTNYDSVAAEIEQVLFRDQMLKDFYNRVKRNSIHEERQEMITEPAVVGSIHNSENKKPIGFAKVQVLDSPYYGISDARGGYYLTPNLKDGLYDIEICAAGYEKKIIKINTKKSKTITVNIDLNQT